MPVDKFYTASFARIYDDIMRTVPYGLWYNYLREILVSFDKNPRKILDMACGTGNMTLRFAHEYREIVGIDKSTHMLKIAKEKVNSADNVKFIKKDIRDFTFPEEFDFIFCIFDSLNYILKKEDLKKVFINVYNSLQDDGIFVFDLNTVNRLMSIEPGTTVFKGDGYTCFWEDIIDKGRMIWKVKLKIYLDDDETECYQEIHQETGYKTKRVRKLLYDTGFSQVQIYKAFTFDKGNDKDNRLYYIVFKSGKVKQKNSVFYKLKNKIKWKVLDIL